jgi:putative transposon-encoded protein
MRNGMRHKGAVLDKRVQAVTEGTAELFGSQGIVQESVTSREGVR